MKFALIAILVVCGELKADAITYKQCDEKSTCINMDFLQTLLKMQTVDAQVRPVFFASLKRSVTLRGIDDVLKFDDVKINRGLGYHRSTGAFRAPRVGVYHISCSVMAIGGGMVQFHLMKNEFVYTNGHASKGEYDSGSLSILIELKKGDIVYIKHRTGSTQRVFGEHYSHFSGYFLTK